MIEIRFFDASKLEAEILQNHKITKEAINLG